MLGNNRITLGYTACSILPVVVSEVLTVSSVVAGGGGGGGARADGDSGSVGKIIGSILSGCETNSTVFSVC